MYRIIEYLPQRKGNNSLEISVLAAKEDPFFTLELTKSRSDGFVGDDVLESLAYRASWVEAESQS